VSIALIQNKTLKKKTLLEEYDRIFKDLDKEKILDKIREKTGYPLIVIIDDFQKFLPSQPEERENFKKLFLAFQDLHQFERVRFVCVASDASCYSRVKKMYETSRLRRIELPKVSYDDYLKIAKNRFRDESLEDFKYLYQLSVSFNILVEIMELKKKEKVAISTAKDLYVNDRVETFYENYGTKLNSDIIEKANKLEFKEKDGQYLFIRVEDEELLEFMSKTNLFAFEQNFATKPKSAIALNIFREIIKKGGNKPKNPK